MIYFAHRGLSDYAPENTMIAFEKAVQAGAKAIELDIQLTADGKIVVMHDFYLGRTNDGQGLLMEQDYEKIAGLDAGKWFAPEFSGERIPLLEEVLQQVPKEIFLNIEMKKLAFDKRKDFAKKLVDLLHCYPREVLVSSFDHHLLKAVQEEDDSIPLGLLYCSNLIDIFRYAEQSGLKISAIHPSIEYVNPDLVEQAHERNIKVNVYTIKQQLELDLMKRWQVDGVFVNRLENWR